MFLPPRSVALGIILALSHPVSFAQDAAIQTLIDQGQYWQAKGDAERAAQAWNKLLLIDPADGRALYALAMIDLEAKRLDGAREYLAKIRASDPNSQFIAILEQDIRLKSGNNLKLLEEARALQSSGDSAKSVARYKQALGGKPPTGEMAVEYYKTACDSVIACEDSVRALEQLPKDAPNKSEIELAIAWNLTRIPDRKKRIDGIERLSRIALAPNAQSFVTDYWRKGLMWLEPVSPADGPLFATYLKANPSDTEIRRLYENGLKQYQVSPSRINVNTPLNSGFKALDRGDRAFAESEFSKRLDTAPNDADAIGGLGVIRMQQNNLVEAQKLLTQAVSMQGGQAWTSALNSVRYLTLVEQANTAQRAGEMARARTLLQQATRLDPKQNSAQISLASIHLELNEYDAAEKIYRGLLIKNKNDGPALRGLIEVLAKSNKLDQARQLLQTVNPAQVGGIDQMNQLKAAYSSALARDAMKRGDWLSAVAALEVSMSNDQDNPWIRLELAQIYMKQGRPAQARELFDSLMARQLATGQSNTPSALYAGALLAGERRDWAGALQLVERIPAKDRNTDMIALQKRAQIFVQISLAVSLAQQDRRSQALAVMSQTQSAIGNNAEFLGAVASAYAEIGDPATGLNLVRQAMSRGPQPSTEVMLQYGALLLRTNQDIECARVLKEINARKLTASDRKGFEDLLFTYSVRQAELLRERGDLTEASSRLLPLLAQRPDDTQANLLQARLLAASGKSENAVAIFKQLVQKNPDSVDVQLGAAQVGLQVNDSSYAELSIQNALALAPDDAQVSASAARLYSAEGKLSRAEELFERAVIIQANTVKSLQSLDSLQPVGLTQTGSALSAIPVPASSVLKTLVTNPSFAPGASDLVMASPNTIIGELDQIKQLRSPELLVGLQVRNRDGSSGTSKLTDVETPVEMRLPFGDGKFSLQATAVSLNAGAIDSDFYSRSTFGGGPSVALDQLAGLLPASDPLKANGVGLALGYKMRGLSVDAGVTPIGFQYSNFTGGIKIDGTLDHANTFSYGLNVSSRPVTDSVLSFAGTRDSVTGLTSGGVMATGVKAQVGKDLGGYGVTGSAGFYSLNGHNVASNTRTDANLGLYFNLVRKQDETVTLGVNAGAAFYDKNLSGFTYGQGGYFSPQQYYALTLPLNWTQRQGAFTYKMSGAIGVQTYKQNASDYFPNNSDLQTAANAAMASAVTNKLIGSNQAVFPEQTNTGMAYNMAAAGEYRVNPYVALGGTVQLDNASNYRQWGAGMYMRFSFYPQQGPSMMPVSPYISPYGQ